MLCGVAGVLLANLTLYVSPSYLAWTTSGELIVMVALGGMARCSGPSPAPWPSAAGGRARC